MIRKDIWIRHLRRIYKNEDTARKTADRMEERFKKYEGNGAKRRTQISEKDVLLITYGDTLRREEENGITTLHRFLRAHVGDAISRVHILPMNPYSSDDGFSVVDYRKINPALGDWNDLKKLGEDYILMYDAVINHVSKSSEWFHRYLRCEEPYRNYFITCDPKADYTSVIRPRALPLLTAFETAEGKKYVWTTFSDDQIDLNYRCPDVLIEILDVLLMYAANGAGMIRLDAIGFLWKELGTGCMHLPETHETIRLIRDVLADYAPGTLLVTETNVPQAENISYFGSGTDEASLVYQFPLPLLVLFSFLKGEAVRLTQWAEQLPEPPGGAAYLNFLSSHDGIGLRPVEGILQQEEIDFLIQSTLRSGGEVSYRNNSDGSRSPYELNINYQDALATPEDSDDTRISRFIAAETLLLSMQGLPGIYIHSLLGSRNDYLDKATSGLARRINRGTLDVELLEQSLSAETGRRRIFDELIRRIRIRRAHKAFSPDAAQVILRLDRRVFALRRIAEEETITVLVNVSGEEVSLNGPSGVDLLSGRQEEGKIRLRGYGCKWIWTPR